MIGNKSIIGIIPARAGSKGLIDKNIRYLMGKPLIAWSIEVGLLSKYIDELVVSTDSSDIAKISEEIGATVPFLRPLDLASDDASTIAVIEHALNYFRTVLDKQFDYCVILEPTSPLRDVDDIDKAIEQGWVNVVNSSYSQKSLIEMCRISTIGQHLRDGEVRILKTTSVEYLDNLKNETLPLHSRVKVIFTNKFDWGDL